MMAIKENPHSKKDCSDYVFICMLPNLCSLWFLLVAIVQVLLTKQRSWNYRVFRNNKDIC